MSGLQIRDAREADRDLIREVTLAAYQEYAAPMQTHWEPYKQSILDTLADIAPAEQLVADQDGTLVGTVLLFPAGTRFSTPGGPHVTLAWPEIRLLAVAPSARGRGVAGALMAECLRRARQAGADAITLHTTDMMRVAQAMYERMGFQRLPEFDFQPAPGITIKGYRLPLDPAAPP